MTEPLKPTFGRGRGNDQLQPRSGGM